MTKTEIIAKMNQCEYLAIECIRQLEREWHKSMNRKQQLLARAVRLSDRREALMKQYQSM